MRKPLAVAVRIYEEGMFCMADIRTSPYDGSILETIVWTNAEERNRFDYNGYTLFYDERVCKDTLVNDVTNNVHLKVLTNFQ